MSINQLVRTSLLTIRVDDELDLCLVDRVLAPQIVEIILSEKEYLGEWLAWPQHTNCLNDYLEYVKIVSLRYAKGKGMACNILYQGSPVGTAGFNYINPSLKKAEIGNWL